MLRAHRRGIDRRWLAVPLTMNALCVVGWLVSPWPVRECPVTSRTFVRLELPRRDRCVDALRIVIHEKALDVPAGAVEARASFAAVIRPDRRVSMGRLVAAIDEIEERMASTTVLLEDM